MINDDNNFQLLQEFFKTAMETLSDGVWDYLIGGAETETTLRRNRAALDALAFRPRVLCDVDHVDPSVNLLDHTLRIPVVLAPIGGLQDFDPGGGAAVAVAADQFGVMSMLSSVSKPDLETVGAACEGPKIFQLYVRGDEAWVDGHIHRAIDAGYVAFCLTVDLDYYSKRERDIAKRYVTTARKADVHGEQYQRRFTWADVERIKSTFDIPLIIKGIATAEDARIAKESGVDVIYVSNHGGRQLDHSLGAIDVLPEVVDAVNGAAKVMVDGGILRGTDVVKAMALGADAVGIGRLYSFGLAAAGGDGVKRVLEILEAEIVATLGLLGVCHWTELSPDYLYKEAQIVQPPGFESAFPLLEEGY